MLSLEDIIHAISDVIVYHKRINNITVSTQLKLRVNIYLNLR